MKIFPCILCLVCIPHVILAQMDVLHGDAANLASTVHSGNRFRTTIHNDGTIGKIQATDIAGEWPVNSGRLYLVDGNVFVGSEIVDTFGDKKHVMSEVRSCDIQYSSGDKGPAGEWWTFLPLPGFHNAAEGKIAMSTSPSSWPAAWSDKLEDPVDPGWANAWNGYLGKNVIDAGQESYFVADDYHNKEYLFYPDSADLSRRGLGMRMYVRGFQWSDPRVDDALFMLFTFENIGTYDHDKMVFGFKVGNDMGSTNSSRDVYDDCGAYDQVEDMAFLYDYDDIGSGGWAPVGYFAAVLLESPGNFVDGIDNDGDAAEGPGRVISADMFQARILHAGDPIVVINYKTFERTIMSMPSDALNIKYKDLLFTFYPGKEINEISGNNFDDNLNGLIDENNGCVLGTAPNFITKYLYIGAKYIDYITGIGIDNPLIDERCDDQVDNDQDWSVIKDDVGKDGVPNTFDIGEFDGLPTAGEPNYDGTDIHESDMIGLTSVSLFYWPDIPLYDDEMVWQNLLPGYFKDNLQNDNIELLIGSGYFSMLPDQSQRFSLALACAYRLDDLYETKDHCFAVCSNNYRLPEPMAVASRSDIANSFVLCQNYPNPFNSSSTIRYVLQQNSKVQIDILNIMGQSIRTLANGFEKAQAHQVTWDGVDDLGMPVAGGVYFYRLCVSTDHVDFSEIKKMILLK